MRTPHHQNATRARWFLALALLLASTSFVLALPPFEWEVEMQLPEYRDAVADRIVWSTSWDVDGRLLLVAVSYQTPSGSSENRGMNRVYTLDLDDFSLREIHSVGVRDDSPQIAAVCVLDDHRFAMLVEDDDYNYLTEVDDRGNALVSEQVATRTSTEIVYGAFWRGSHHVYLAKLLVNRGSRRTGQTAFSELSLLSRASNGQWTEVPIAHFEEKTLLHYYPDQDNLELAILSWTSGNTYFSLDPGQHTLVERAVPPDGPMGQAVVGSNFSLDARETTTYENLDGEYVVHTSSRSAEWKTVKETPIDDIGPSKLYWMPTPKVIPIGNGLVAVPYVRGDGTFVIRAFRIETFLPQPN